MITNNCIYRYEQQQCRKENSDDPEQVGISKRSAEGWREPKAPLGSSWSNYKKRVAILKACNLSEMHMGALVAMSMTSVDNTQVYSYSSFVCFMCCFRVCTGILQYDEVE